MKWIKRIGLALLGIILLIVVIFAGIIIFDSLFGTDTSEFTNVTYTDQDGTDLIGYLAQP